MLTIKIPSGEIYNEVNNEFIPVKEHVIRLEHSLVSLSKWEEKWHKPFLTDKEKTREEIIDYIRCMTITQNVDPNAYMLLTRNNIRDIEAYISDPRTATTIKEKECTRKEKIITNEIIYYWMISFNIPVEFEKWHLNKLLTLIRVCSIKNQPPKKMSRNEILSRNAAINAARRKRLNSKG